MPLVDLERLVSFTSILGKIGFHGNKTTLLKEKKRKKEMRTEIEIADMSKLIFIHKTFWGNDAFAQIVF